MIDGRAFEAFNDSKSTTPDSTLQAFASVRERGPVRLIAGGYDKGIDLSPLASLPVAGLYSFGSTAHKIGSMTFETLDQAIAAVMGDVRSGEVVLLSPACASWDQFTNYAERGDRFKRAIAAHAERINACV